MKIPVPIKIAVLTIVATGFYTYVGQLVPQKEVLPPEVIEIPTTVTTAEMVEIGRAIFDDKGLCSTCHTLARYPDLTGIATRAGERIPGLSALDYLAQSLYEPEVYIVDGFDGGMPAINKPPIQLTDQEILTVLAYLQSLGGEPDITMQSSHMYYGGAGEGD